MQNDLRLSGAAERMPRRLAQAIIEVPAAVAARHPRQHPEVARWADGVARVIDEEPHGVAVRLGGVTADIGRARVLAHDVAVLVRDALVRRGAPESMEIEHDAAQSSEVAAHERYRTLLPHHDGGNASFLTPSSLDDPLITEEHRRTSPARVTTTRAHKLYQGFFLRAVGDGHSVTTYYDLVAILRGAYQRQTGALPRTAADLARWTGVNVRHALGVIKEFRGTYLTLGGMLGSRDPMACVTAVHRVDSIFDEDQTARFPALKILNEADVTGLSPAERLLDRALLDLVGKGWLSICERYEVGVDGAPGDLLLGHNLTLLHGGWRGGRGRIIEPICFTISTPAGEDYERWLWQAWRRPAQDVEVSPAS